ncbi:hypothetical protein HOY82DRAFT_575904 [Tuber indicum]|nr:hypothetical protein HOY82DRAFT_575904 [Tuber indicum]
MGPCSNPPSSPPRLPSPPPFSEVPISSVPLSLSLYKSPVRPESNPGTRRIRPGTKSHDIAARLPVVPLSELESALQLPEHLASLLAATAYQRLATPPEGIEEYLASEWQCLCALHDPRHRLSLHNTRVKHLASILRRLYRIFAHARIQHRSFFQTVSGKSSLIPEDNLTIRPAVEGVKSKNSFGEVDSDEEEIDEFDLGTGSIKQGQELNEDENFPDRDESESNEEQAKGAEEGELEIENSIEGDEVQDNEFDLDIDDDHSVEEDHSLVSSMETYKLTFGVSFRASSLGTPSTLDIAVYAPFLSCLSAVRGRHFDKTQHLFARLYSVVTSVAVEEKRELEVDAQIILLSDIGPKLEEMACGLGPLIGLPELAKSGREWKNMIAGAHGPGSSEGHGNREVEEAEGPVIEKAFMCYSGDKVTGFIDFWRFARLIVAGMPSTSTTSLYPFADPYKVGGTFDHLDPGHKPLLTMTAFLLSPNTTEPSLVAGITGETPLINKKHSAHLGSWESRVAEFVDFLRVITDLSKNPSQLRTSPSSSTPETEITPHSITATIPDGEKELVIENAEINDPIGPTITNEAISALVVSEETRNGGEAVNKKRTEKSRDALQVYKVDDINNEWRVKMSSTDIRRKLEERSTA